jgi:hypothetical protein
MRVEGRLVEKYRERLGCESEDIDIGGRGLEDLDIEV